MDFDIKKEGDMIFAETCEKLWGPKKPVACIDSNTDSNTDLSKAVEKVPTGRVGATNPKLDVQDVVDINLNETQENIMQELMDRKDERVKETPNARTFCR